LEGVNVMIGKELAKAIRNTRGKICVGITGKDEIVWVYAEKADLIKWADSKGSEETGMKLFPEENGNGIFLDIDYSVNEY
jgi:hypothetical protein